MAVGEFVGDGIDEGVISMDKEASTRGTAGTLDVDVVSRGVDTLSKVTSRFFGAILSEESVPFEVVKEDDF